MSLCGINRVTLVKSCPTEIAFGTTKGKLLWATALALVLLRGKFFDRKDEWEMIAEKAKKWLNKSLPAALKYDSIVQYAATATGL